MAVPLCRSSFARSPFVLSLSKYERTSHLGALDALSRCRGLMSSLMLAGQPDGALPGALTATVFQYTMDTGSFSVNKE